MHKVVSLFMQKFQENHGAGSERSESGIYTHSVPPHNGQTSGAYSVSHLKQKLSYKQ
jgi:hypothetical protein